MFTLLFDQAYVVIVEPTHRVPFCALMTQLILGLLKKDCMKLNALMTLIITDV